MNRANATWATLQGATQANNIDPALLAAIGVRESGFQNEWQSRGGSGAGVFQIDLSKNPGVTSAQAFNISWAANYVKVVPVAEDQTDYATRTWKTLLANGRLQDVRFPSEHWIVARVYLRDPDRALSPEGFADLMGADAALWEIPPLMQTRLVQLMDRMEKTGFDASISPNLPETAQFLYSSFAIHMIHAPGKCRSWYGWAS